MCLQLMTHLFFFFFQKIKINFRQNKIVFDKMNGLPLGSGNGNVDCGSEHHRTHTPINNFIFYMS